MQIQIWSTGQIAHAYGSITTITSGNNGLTIGLQYPGGGCNALANKLSTSLSNQSYSFAWDANASACQQIPTVNHFEIRESGTATMCTEPVKVLAVLPVQLRPCPAADVIISNQIINAAVTVTGTGTGGHAEYQPPPALTFSPSSSIRTVESHVGDRKCRYRDLGDFRRRCPQTGASVCTQFSRHCPTNQLQHGGKAIGLV